jgi:hypothetical protein
MRQKRKTKADRAVAFEVSQSAAWTKFQTKLCKIQTFVAAELLARNAPRPDAPGPIFYSNLAFFLQTFHLPSGANPTELRHYLALMNRLDASGGLKPGVKDRVAKSIMARLETAPPT